MVEKRFPATVAIDDDVTTFLHDKKINAELYAYLQSKSYPDDNKRTIVKKSDLDKQDEICKIIGIHSRSTLRSHLVYLIKVGYVVDEKDAKQYYLPDLEQIYLLIPLDTLHFIQDTVKEAVYKVYIYLGQRWKYKPGYTFTQEEIAQHLGLSLAGNETVRRQIKNCLIALQNNGLIDFEQFYEGKIPKYKLLNWSFHYTTKN